MMTLNDSGSMEDLSGYYFNYPHQQQQLPLGAQQQQGPHSPHHNRRPVIDYSKFKTKMCRHYLMGLPCPFEDRCAFAHGNDQIRNQALPPPPPPPPSYHHFIGSVPESPTESRPDTPPAYPTRFRYEPYSPNGVVYEA